MSSWDRIIASDFLESSALRFAAPFLDEDAAGNRDHPGDLIGRYRLIQQIGRGGMGTVWLAERADGHFEQRVALKLMKHGHHSPELLTHFLRERQILAHLEHPHIARLLDGGVSDDDRPYFVMEMVGGTSITQYCADRQLSVDDRLRLFSVVCRAVHSAHQCLVIHRDIKPSNVLISNEGSVKLLDFGIATTMADEPQPMRVATPGYASPEQLEGRPVMLASDIYQLGILLHELLTGQRPGKVDTALPGDLGFIVGRALQRDPAARYASAAAMADDIERHLAHLPLAGYGGVRYRTAKFIRRNRFYVGAATLLMATSLALATAYVRQVRIDRDRALREAEKAARSDALLHRFFAAWRPDAADRDKVSASEVLQAAVTGADRELANDPEMLAIMLSTLGELDAALGQTARADSLLSRALTLQARLAPTSLDYAATLGRRGRLLRALGRYAEAEAAFRQSLALYRPKLKPNRAEVLRAQFDLAETLHPQAKYAEAEQLYRGVLARSPSADAPLTTEAAAGLGYTLFLDNRGDEAGPLLRETLARQRRLFGARHASTLRTLRALGAVLRAPEQIDEAVALDREALTLARSLYGEHHIEVMYSSFALAIRLERKGDFASAEPYARSTVEQFARLQGKSLDASLAQRTLGGILMVRGRAREAEEMLRRSLATMYEAGAAGNADEGDVLNRLAFLAVARAAPDADTLYRRAVAFERARPASVPHFVTDGYHYLAWAAQQKGDRALAKTLYQRALTLYVRELPREHPYRLQTEAGLRN